jgi:transcriptional regulator with XRE-family HTH domain
MADAGEVARMMFGAALRAQRTQTGMSLRELGRGIHYDHSRLSRAENGEHLPALAYVRSMDAVFGTGDLLTTLHGLAEQAGQDRTAVLAIGTGPPGEGDPRATTVELRTPDGRIMRVPISRRQFSELLAAGGFMAMLPTGILNPDETDRLQRVINRPRNVDERIVTYFRRLLEEHYTADKMLGPADLLPAVHAELGMLDRLRREATPRARALLIPVQSQYAEFVGWLHQDAGDTHSAVYYCDRATELAQVAGDRQMVAYMLIRKSYIAYRAGDAVRATDLAAAAQHDPDGIDAKILALASQQEARGWAIAGNYERCEPKLRHAADLLSVAGSAPTPDAPAYIHYYGTEILEEQTATCYRDVGRTEQAITILQRKIDELPAGHDRDRGYRMAKLAVAYAQGHQVQDAASVGLQALCLARQTGSARTENELQPLMNTLSPWRGHTDVANLIDALRTQAS